MTAWFRHRRPLPPAPTPPKETPEETRLRYIRLLYPSWHVDRDSDGAWVAVLQLQLTERRKAFGVLATFRADGPDELSRMLLKQSLLILDARRPDRP
ncbi:hypothetical protein [Nonomuraea bangladeshensis]|uniref:hypothetical protein n=1 Tax=Nonomuraea bangladeshensis TaxID=404385 RepID=UPI003C2F85FB